MSRRIDRELERRLPETAHMIRAAKGDYTALMAVQDLIQEEGLVASSEMMIQQFVVGQAYWLETAIWVYFGRVTQVGGDFIEIGEASRMHVDGRHGTMMASGTAPGIETEPTGGVDRVMRIPIDWIGPNCKWDHVLPAGPMGPEARS